MKRSTSFIIVFMCMFSFASTGFAWTDAVEGMLMPTPRGEDNTTNSEAATESIEPTEGEPTAVDKATDISWE